MNRKRFAAKAEESMSHIPDQDSALRIPKFSRNGSARASPTVVSHRIGLESPPSLLLNQVNDIPATTPISKDNDRQNMVKMNI